ncbi:MAG TPA: hypothetical protein VL137_06860 [Polyangiaceae bacterium]|nr:hypothetical protein [Polyangiaceae bacterium]
MRQRRPFRTLLWRAIFLGCGSVALASGCRNVIGLNGYHTSPTAATTSNHHNNHHDAGVVDAGVVDASSASGNADGSMTPTGHGGMPSGGRGGSGGMSGAAGNPNGGGSGGMIGLGGMGGAGGMMTGGAGGSGGMGGAGGMGGSGGAGGAGCGAAPTPGTCTSGPAGCDGECQNNVCVHDCASPTMCGGSYTMDMIAACGPPDIAFECEIVCDGACTTALKVSCPMDEPCTIDCTAPGACIGANIECHNGPCQVMCGEGSCDTTTTVTCGSGPCIVSCMQGSGADATLVAGPSCAPMKVNCG